MLRGPNIFLVHLNDCGGSKELLVEVMATSGPSAHCVLLDELVHVCCIGVAKQN